MNTLSYGRISQASEDFDKVREQLDQAREWAVQQGHEAPVEFFDNDISATKGKTRKGFNQLLEAVASGDYELLVVKEQSRLERDPMDLERLGLAVALTGTKVYSLAEGWIDLADDDDSFMALIRSGMNRSESRRNSRRVTNRNRLKVAEGKPISTKRSFGREQGNVEVREDEARLLRSGAAAIIRGKSLRFIADAWNAAGSHRVVTKAEERRAEAEGREVERKLWDAAAVSDVLRRESNAGRLVHRGAVVAEGTFPAIIEPARFNIMMGVLNDSERSVTRDRQLKWMMSGAATCGTCGHVMRPTTVNYKPVYRCGSTAPRGAVRHPMIMAVHLDELVTKAVAGYYLFNVPQEVGEDEAAVIQARLVQIGEEKVRAASLAMTPGFEGTFQKMANDLVAEEQDLRRRLDGIARSSASSLIAIEARAALLSSPDKRVSFADAVEVRKQIADRFRDLPLEERRAIIRSLFRITIQPGVGTDRVSIQRLDEDLAA